MKSLLHTKVVSVLALCALLFTMTLPAQAQRATPRVYLERVGAFGVRVLIDSADPINAYDIEIVYNAALAEVDSLDTSRSLVTVLPQPIRAKNGHILIKGGSTTPFSGTHGELLTFTTRPVSEGILEFTVLKSIAYRADGTGAPVAFTNQPLALRVTQASLAAYEQSRVVESAAKDEEPPQIATVSIEENPLHYGERLVVFTAFDAQSGIARYEARDRFWFSWSPWREAVNPYPMSDGAWSVQVKAIDQFGNESLATVYELGSAIWKAGLLLVAFGVLWWGLLTLRRRRTSV